MPHRVQAAVDAVKEKFDSKFEEDVFCIITARGYKVSDSAGKSRVCWEKD
jgi:hypothetical protein